MLREASTAVVTSSLILVLVASETIWQPDLVRAHEAELAKEAGLVDSQV